MNSSGFAQFIPLILIFVIFYFFLIRPQQKRVKDHKAMVASLKRGDEVITSGGTSCLELFLYVSGKDVSKKELNTATYKTICVSFFSSRIFCERYFVLSIDNLFKKILIKH